MPNRNFLERKNADHQRYEPALVQGYPTHEVETDLLVIKVTCGSTAKIARIFGSNDPDVDAENEKNGVKIIPVGVSHGYVRNYLIGQKIQVHNLEVDSTTAGQLKNQWSLISKNIVGESQIKTFQLRTSSGQNIETKVEQNVNWEIGSDQELQIPMKADEELTIGFLISEIN